MPGLHSITEASNPRINADQRRQPMVKKELLIPKDLLSRFESWRMDHGYSSFSEAIRDIVRKNLERGDRYL